MDAADRGGRPVNFFGSRSGGCRRGTAGADRVAQPVSAAGLGGHRPGVGLFEQPQVHEGLGVADALDPGQVLRQQPQQVVVVLAHHLGQHVEGAGGQDQVGHLGQAADGLGDLLAGAAVDRDPDHGHGLVAEGHRVGHGHHLHDPGRLEPGHPLAHGRLGDPELPADTGEGAAPVALQGGHDAPVDRVDPRRPGHTNYLQNALRSNEFRSSLSQSRRKAKPAGASGA